MHDNVTGMVTRIHKQNPGRFYIKAHWKASGLSREKLAGQLGVTPEHVSRLVKNADENHKLGTSRLYQLAEIFGVRADELRLPPRPKDKPKPVSLDAMVEGQPEEFRAEAAQLLEILLRQRRA